MDELEYILKINAERYPLMAPRDAVKLIYQNEFGCGHLIDNENSSLEALIEEMTAAVLEEKVLPFEDIGNGYVRVNLASTLVSGLAPDIINKMFVLSQRSVGCLQSFDGKLEILRRAAQEGIFGFSLSELDSYLNRYRALGYPVVSHSDEYKRAYGPSYRVVDEEFARLIPVASAISELLKDKDRVVVGIDGHAAAGKTSAAKRLSGIYDANVIHMDSFFLPQELRTSERFAEAGGNIHYERFLSEVVAGLKSGLPFSYRIFDCSAMDYKQKETVFPKSVCIIEGSYALHPYFEDIFDIKVFFSVSKEEQKKRILVRDGFEMYEKFVDFWIPMEKLYFDTFGIESKCDLVL